MKTFSFILLLFLSLLATHAVAQTDSYRVQVSAYSQPVKAAYFDGLPSTVVLRTAAQGVYRYYMEGFSSQAEAEQAAKIAQSLGFKFARVVAPRNPNDLVDCCVIYAPSQTVMTPDVATRGMEPRTRSLAPAMSGQAIHNIFFDFDKANIRPDAAEDLEKLVLLMQEHPTYKVSVYAHTDALGNDDYNVRLSGRRRDAAMNYLKRAGIAADRIAAEVYGEAKPIAKNTLPDGSDNPEGRNFNRRVEFTVTENGQRIDVVQPIPVPIDMRED